MLKILGNKCLKVLSFLLNSMGIMGPSNFRDCFRSQFSILKVSICVMRVTILVSPLIQSIYSKTGDSAPGTNSPQL